MRLKKIIIAALLLCVCLLVSCGSAYRCRVMLSDAEASLDAPRSPYTEITVGEKTYALSWQRAHENRLTGGTVDSYTITDAEEPDAYPIDAYIKIHRESGEILSFYGITPYDAVESVTADAVRALLAQFATDVKWEAYTDVSEMQTVSGHTRFRFEMPMYNASIEVELDENGKICYLSKNIAIPERELSISEEEETALIEKALKKEALLQKGMTVKLHAKQYSLCEGADGILYTVSLIDQEGFHIGSYIIFLTEK